MYYWTKKLEGSNNNNNNSDNNDHGIPKSERNRSMKEHSIYIWKKIIILFGGLVRKIPSLVYFFNLEKKEFLCSVFNRYMGFQTGLVSCFIRTIRAGKCGLFPALVL